MKINNRNIELVLFRYKEGLLTPDEKAQVEAILTQHPEWKRMADGYDPSLCITADTTAVYPNKERLRQMAATTPRKRAVLPLWSKMSAAACLLLLVTVALHFMSGNEGEQAPTQQPMLAQNEVKSIPVISDTVEDEPELLIAEVAPVINKAPKASGTQPVEPIAQTATKPACNDQLITYIEEDDTMYSSKFLPFDLAFSTDEVESSEPIVTDQLITYVDTDIDSVADERPVRNYAFEDLVNSLRLSRLEFQTNLYNQFCKLIEK
jgi:hypothetical protein